MAILRARAFLYSFILIVVVVILLLSPATGSHEPNHRYGVTGKVTDSNGNPAACLEVRVQDVTAGLSKTTETSKGGGYSVGFHLHNNNVGDTIRVSAGGATNETKASFNPSDARTPRGDTLDLRLNGESKTTCPDETLLLWMLLGLGAALGIVGLAIFLRRRMVFSRFTKERKSLAKEAVSKKGVSAWATCPDCGAKLKSKNLKPHIRSVHGGKGKPAS